MLLSLSLSLSLALPHPTVATETLVIEFILAYLGCKVFFSSVHVTCLPPFGLSCHQMRRSDVQVPKKIGYHGHNNQQLVLMDRLFPAPKLTDVYRKPSMSTYEK